MFIIFLNYVVILISQINATNKLVAYFPDNNPDQDGSEASVGV